MADTEINKSNILLVDDEREHAQVMCEALQRQGHRCDVTYSLAEAMGRLEKKKYDVVVTDLVMEGRRDGLEVLRATQSLQPQPPLILVTAHGDVPTAVQAMNQGAYR
jgi:DNA-binding NtrC family response regulator